MDVKALMDIYRKEKMSPYLQDLGEDFYSEVDALIHELEAQYSKSEGSAKKQSALLKELENVKSVIDDIYEIRERKVVMGALNYVRRDDAEIEMENLTEGERKMLDNVIAVLGESRSAVMEKAPAKKPKNKKPKKQTSKEQAAHPLVTVRITKALPSIVGADGKVYGEFKEEDVVTLPDANAKALIEQGAAEEIQL